MEEQTLTSTSPEGEEQQLPKPPEIPEGAAVKPPEGAEKEGVEKETPTPPPPEKTRTEEEWRKRQSTWDTALEEVKKQHTEAIKQVRVELATQQRTQLLAKVQVEAEAEGSDVQKAVQKAGTLFDREQAVVAKEQEQEALAGILQTATKDRDADGYISKFGLPKEAKDALLKAETPAEMTTLALEMALEATKATKTPPVKTPSAVPSGKAVDLSKASPHDRLGEYFAEKLAGE